jgi:hypothetical protein
MRASALSNCIASLIVAPRLSINCCTAIAIASLAACCCDAAAGDAFLVLRAAIIALHGCC